MCSIGILFFLTERFSCKKARCRHVAVYKFDAHVMLYGAVPCAMLSLPQACSSWDDSVVISWKSAAGVPKISYTFVRGASDYLYAPPLQVSPGVWVDNPAVPPTNFETQVHLPPSC